MRRRPTEPPQLIEESSDSVAAVEAAAATAATAPAATAACSPTHSPLSRVLHTPEGGVHAFLSEPGTHGLADSQRTRISGSDSAGSGGGGLYVTVKAHVCVCSLAHLVRHAGSFARCVRAARERKASL